MLSPDRRKGGLVRLLVVAIRVDSGLSTFRSGAVARWCGECEATRQTEGEGAPMSQELGQDGLPASGPTTPSGSATPPPPAASALAAASGAGPAAPPPPWVSPGRPQEPEPVSRLGPTAPRSPNPWQPPRPGAAGGPQSLRPGSTPLRPLDVGDILDGTFSVIRRNPRAILLLAALLVSLQQLLVLVIQIVTGGLSNPLAPTFSRMSTQAAGAVGVLLGVALSTLVGAVLTAMIVVVVAEDLLGHRASIGHVWSRVRPRLAALLAAALVSGLLPYIGLLFFLVPGAILWGCWALTTPALILERLGPFQAMRRSWRLAWPDFFRVWGIRALSVLLGALMQGVVTVSFVVISLAIANGSDSGAHGPLLVLAITVQIVGAIIGGTVVQPFLAGVLALLYTDRRMRSEGLDIVLQLRMRRERSAANGARTPAGSPTADTHVDAQLANWGALRAVRHAGPGTSPP